MKITFEGQSHQIDANTLICVLGHYQAILTEANKELGGSKAIELRINALEKGSFVIDISVIGNAISNLFSADSVSYISGLTTIVAGVYGAYKKLKGRPAKTKAEKDAIAVKVAGNNNTVINNCIVNVYNQPPVREAVSKTIEASDSDINVEGLSIANGNDKPVTFERKDFKDYIYDSFDEELIIPDEKEEIVETLLTIIALNFEQGSTWQFMYNGFKIPIRVKDDALMKKIDEGERFGKGDAIRVRMKIIKRYNATFKTYENKQYRIEEFIEHIETPKHYDMF